MADFLGQEDILALFGDDPAAAQMQARALADAMQRRRAAGTIATVIGGPFAQAGKAFLGEAGQSQNDLMQAGQYRSRDTFLKSKASDDSARQAAEFEERQRHNRAMEARPPMPLLVQTGEGPMLVNPREPKAPAVPVTDAGGKRVGPSPKSTRPLQTGDKNALEEMSSTVESLDYLDKQFRPDFAGGGALGGMATSAYQMLGSSAPKGAQEDAAFWAEWDKLINLPERNKIFGASLSTGEKAAWEGARTIKPGSSPDLVKSQLIKMRNIAASKLKARAEALRSEGYNDDAISALTRGLDAGPATAPAALQAKIRKFNPQTGELE